MTTSGVYSFSVTRDDIIRMALINIGKLDPFDIPDAQTTTDCAMMLNALCKQWMGKADFAPGLKVWTRKHGHLFLSNITGQYTIGPGATGWTNSYHFTTLSAAAGLTTALTLTSIAGMTVGDHIGIEQTDGSLFWTTIATLPSTSITIASALTVGAASGAQIFTYTTAAQQPIVIETAVLRDQNLDDTPVRVLTVQDYDNLPTKVDPTFIQDPTAIYYEFQLSNSILYTDAGAAQDVTKHLVLTYMEPIQDFVNSTDTPYYPQEWYMALFWGLAKNICPMFNRVWTELQEENFKTSLAIAQKKDPERITLFFQPGAED